MPFAYYNRLPASQKAIYRKSDAVNSVPLPHPDLLHDLVGQLQLALERDDRRGVEAVAHAVCRGLTTMLDVPPVRVSVLAVRPSASWGELQGLYTADDGKTPLIRVWMRTAQRARVVAFRTFLRTLLHELCHHLDYHHLKLDDSLHTEGFFKREASLFRQLVPEAAPRAGEG